MKIFRIVLISHYSVKVILESRLYPQAVTIHLLWSTYAKGKYFLDPQAFREPTFLSYSLYDIFLLILVTRLIWLPAKELVLSLNCLQTTKSVWQLTKSDTRVTLFFDICFGVENYEIEQIMPSRVQEASIYLKSIVTMNFCCSCWSWIISFRHKVSSWLCDF